jgi:hypothetical protein
MISANQVDLCTGFGASHAFQGIPIWFFHELLSLLILGFVGVHGGYRYVFVCTTRCSFLAKRGNRYTCVASA